MSYGMRGLGETPAVAIYPVAIVQDLLRRKGFRLGPQGVNGTWDTRTQLALEEALRQPVSSADVRVSGNFGSQSVQMPAGYFEFVAALPERGSVWPWVAGIGAVAALLVWGGAYARQLRRAR